MFRLYYNMLASSQDTTIIQTEDKLAYCWFSRPRSLSVGGKTCIGVVADFGTGQRSGIVVINENDDTFQGIELSSVIESDDHNETSLLQRSLDNKIIAGYCEHSTSNIIRWKISTNANDVISWGVEQTKNVGVNVTYAALYEAENGEIFYFFRADKSSSTPGWNYCKSTDGGATFENRVWLHDSESLPAGNSYVIFNQDPNNKNILHFVGTHAAPLNSTFDLSEDPNKVWHGYFDLSTETWYNSTGQAASSLPIDFTTSDVTIIDTKSKPQDLWIEDIAVDSTGNPRVLYTLYTDVSEVGQAREKYLMYSEFNGSVWSTPYQIHLSQNGYIEKETVANVRSRTYPPLARFDDRNINIIWASKEVDSICEIHELTRISSNSFISEQKTFNSTYHQWRPNSIPSGKYRLYWLNSRVYFDFLNYDQDLVLGY